MLLIVHGGAGSLKPQKKVLKKLSESLSSGRRILIEGGTAIDAVIETIKILEDSGTFNAGLGGNFQLDGIRRLDASVMEGRFLRAGSVIGLEGIRNPIVTALFIMDMPHVMLTHQGAKRIANAEKIAVLSPSDKKAFARLKKAKKKEKVFMKVYQQYFSTVGAVALDKYGDLSAGASTGGIPIMFPGRVGDTPVIGAGIYADNSFGAISCTGMGEYIIRLSLAKEICMNMGSMSPYKATAFSLRRLQKIGGDGGVILINGQGRFTIAHTTKYMPSGYADKKGISVR
jgi:beta-aspartyl-peptidase (threonine type)